MMTKLTLSLHPTYHWGGCDHQAYCHHCPTGLYLKGAAWHCHCSTYQNLEGLAYHFHLPTYQFLEEPAPSLQFPLAGIWAHTFQRLVQQPLQALDQQEAQKT
jgi:hypothetical protein